jgi:hypothetical protein
MKKIIFLALAIILSVWAMAQKQGFYLCYNVPTSTTLTTEYIKAGTFVMITNDTTLYLCKINIGRGNTLASTMLASASNYAIINRAIFGGKNPSFFVDTTSAQNIYGVKSFKNNVSFAGTTTTTGNATFGGTLGVTGNFAVNTNKFTVAGASGNTYIGGIASIGGATLYPTVNNATSLGGSTYRWSTIYGVDLNVTNAASNLTPKTANTYDLGTALNYWRAIHTAAITSGALTVSGASSLTGVATFTERPVMTTGLTLTAETDTTTKTAGRIVYIGGKFYGCNGTYYYKFTNVVNN